MASGTDSENLQWIQCHGRQNIIKNYIQTREVTVRTGELISKTITTMPKAVCTMESFRLKLWKLYVLYLPFSVIPVVYCSSGRNNVKAVLLRL